MNLLQTLHLVCQTDQKFSRCEMQRYILNQMQWRDQKKKKFHRETEVTCVHFLLRCSDSRFVRPPVSLNYMYLLCHRPLCRCNHIWQVGSCTLCGVYRRRRRSWMDEPETKHAVLTLRDAFCIIYLRARSLLKINCGAQQWLRRTSMTTRSLWKGPACFSSLYAQTLTLRLKSLLSKNEREIKKKKNGQGPTALQNHLVNQTSSKLIFER